jgi:hypothetical protein
LQQKLTCKRMRPSKLTFLVVKTFPRNVKLMTSLLDDLFSNFT